MAKMLTFATGLVFTGPDILKIRSVMLNLVI